MIGVIKEFYQKTVHRLSKEAGEERLIEIPSELPDHPPERVEHLESLILFGVLLDRVAYADRNISEEEAQSIRRILKERSHLEDEEIDLVMAAAREAAESRPDIYSFVRELKDLSYKERTTLVEHLFEVAFADRHLSNIELESVRQIANLLWVSHKDFIEAKLRVKKSLGLS